MTEMVSLSCTIVEFANQFLNAEKGFLETVSRFEIESRWILQIHKNFKGGEIEREWLLGQVSTL